MTTKPLNVLFLCTGNSARSILAESILRKDGGGQFNAYSAGSYPKGEVNPMALETLQELGYPTDGLRSKSWDKFAVPGAPVMDFVFTVCDQAAGEAFTALPLATLERASLTSRVHEIGQLEGASLPRPDVA